MKNNSIINKKIPILIDISILIVLLIYMLCSYKAVRPSVYEPDFEEVQVIANGNGFEAGIDGASITAKGSKPFLELKGWAIQTNVNSTKFNKKKLVLRNAETGEYVSVPTKIESRTDISDLKYDGCDYIQSGFRAKAYTDNLINPDCYTYDILVLYNTSTGQKLIETGMTLNTFIYREE